MITSSGLICDICDEYILWGAVQEFKVDGLVPDQILHCHTEGCEQKLKDAGEDWDKLPTGRLRKLFETATQKAIAVAEGKV